MKKNLVRLIVVAGASLALESSANAKRMEIDLGGNWEFQLDVNDRGIGERWHQASLNDQIVLPGTTSTNKKGPEYTKKDTYNLTDPYQYEGVAWYRKTVNIPEDWKNKRCRLLLERTKATDVWIDGHRHPQQSSLSAPHIYEIETPLSPGKHTIAIRVDNRKKLFPVGGSHAVANATQGNWNGIIGDLKLVALPDIYIEGVRIFPDIHTKQVKVETTLVNRTGKSVAGFIAIVANGSHGNSHQVDTQQFEFSMTGEEQTFVHTYAMGDGVKLWDEFSPNLYTLKVAVKVGGTKSSITDHFLAGFGMREFKAVGSQFVVNGKTISLRGKHDACVFPLTGHPPMEVEGWLRYLTICKDYGFNHVRFHSWCPPEAAFEAADRVGVYLQPELPNWKGFNPEDKNHISYMETEGIRILKLYGNYSSFNLFALGNELGGSREVMAALLDHYKKYDTRPLYAQGANNYFWDPKRQPGEDFFVSARVATRVDGFVNDIRASFSFANDPKGGIINAQYPNTERTFESAVRQLDVPAIGHETGQYQVYPDFKEIKKYTGVMKARNFEVFRERLRKKGGLDRAEDYFINSGKHSVNCYREDIEMCMRSKGFGGFQVLDLQDFPGQGTALVGILDAFMDSKGLITAEEWRQFCAAQTLQAKMPRYVWNSEEKLTAEIILINYGEKSVAGGALKWKLVDSAGETFQSGDLNFNQVPQGEIYTLGRLVIPLSKQKSAEKFLLQLSAGGLKTSYPIWVYPSPKEAKIGEVSIVKNLDSATLQKLVKGDRMLLIPPHADIEKQSIGGLFITDYWCYPMFRAICQRGKKPVSPGTLGLLIKDKHPLFKEFPTETHSDWQWWSIVKNTRPLVLDAAPKSYYPIVQAIDNFERNQKLGLLFECRVGKGRLMVCPTDFSKADDIAGMQYRQAILNYMNSDAFQPEMQIDAKQLLNILYTQAKASNAYDPYKDNRDRTGGYDKLEAPKSTESKEP